MSIEAEAKATYDRFVALRDKIDGGDAEWSQLADFFTEDGVYIDPAWGRIETQDGIRAFFEKSMAGLTGHGWSTPENWTMAEGHRLISQWDQVMGEKEDGSLWSVPGLSILYYAGDGRFCYSLDLLNMGQVNESLRGMQWKPPETFNMPPKRPNRDVSLPAAWAHLAK